VGVAITKGLRFAMDEKGMKVLAPTLVGQRMSYWDNDRQLKHGMVRGADVARDRYGNPYIEVTIDEETGAGSDHGAVVEATGAVGESESPPAAVAPEVAAEAATEPAS
jgi:hypothetical protein